MLRNSTIAGVALVVFASFAGCDSRNEITSSSDVAGNTVPVDSVLQANADNPDSAFDLVIMNGRVLDPASGRDEILNVGIKDGSIVALTTDELHGGTVIDAADHLVAPGFIDLHTHSPFPLGQMLQTKDA